jgi:hypothetical protein
VTVCRRKGVSIAALRNFGAQQGRGRYLSFVDVDCAVAPDYFVSAVSFLESTGASATGCEVSIPENPNWIEATWHDLHYVGRERDVRYLNSGNFFLLRDAFCAIGGFREDLRTGEDAEIGERLTVAGYRIRSCPRVAAIHFGNPTSIRGFYRRNVWHGLGMFGTVTRRRIDRPTAMMVAHFTASVAGVILLVTAPFNLAARIVTFACLQLLVPVVTVGYRAMHTRWTARAVWGAFLYWLYYWARLQALVLILGGRASRFRK